MEIGIGIICCRRGRFGWQIHDRSAEETLSNWGVILAVTTLLTGICYCFLPLTHHAASLASFLSADG
ncbi:hypothetical protein ACFFSY_21385 [Paenibacillus aurantiacus]|uniref:Uncharacterized protein n=1 Tax=Paenibacillus aurantiacus TaxID=1936118 RepID=A0ABV5KTE7_9BACL